MAPTCPRGGPLPEFPQEPEAPRRRWVAELSPRLPGAVLVLLRSSGLSTSYGRRRPASPAHRLAAGRAPWHSASGSGSHNRPVMRRPCKNAGDKKIKVYKTQQTSECHTNVTVLAQDCCIPRCSKHWIWAALQDGPNPSRIPQVGFNVTPYETPQIRPPYSGLEPWRWLRK